MQQNRHALCKEAAVFFKREGKFKAHRGALYTSGGSFDRLACEGHGAWNHWGACTCSSSCGFSPTLLHIVKDLLLHKHHCGFLYLKKLDFLGILFSRLLKWRFGSSKTTLNWDHKEALMLTLVRRALSQRYLAWTSPLFVMTTTGKVRDVCDCICTYLSLDEAC